MSNNYTDHFDLFQPKNGKKINKKNKNILAFQQQQTCVSGANLCVVCSKERDLHFSSNIYMLLSCVCNIGLVSLVAFVQHSFLCVCLAFQFMVNVMPTRALFVWWKRDVRPLHPIVFPVFPVCKKMTNRDYFFTTGCQKEMLSQRWWSCRNVNAYYTVFHNLWVQKLIYFNTNMQNFSIFNR